MFKVDAHEDGSVELTGVATPLWDSERGRWVVHLTADQAAEVVAAQRSTAAEIDRAVSYLKSTFSYIDVDEYDGDELKLVASAALGAPVLRAEVERFSGLGWRTA